MPQRLWVPGTNLYGALRHPGQPRLGLCTKGQLQPIRNKKHIGQALLTATLSKWVHERLFFLAPKNLPLLILIVAAAELLSGFFSPVGGSASYPGWAFVRQFQPDPFMALESPTGPLNASHSISQDRTVSSVVLKLF